MADVERIKGNIEKMIGQNAPESDIDAYLGSEGFKSADDWRAALSPPQSFGQRVMNGVQDAYGAATDFAKRAGEYRDTQFIKSGGGIAGLPRLTADATSWLGSKVGLSPDDLSEMPGINILMAGRNLPSGSDISKYLIDQKTNAPALPGNSHFQERSINPVVDAGVQSVIGGPVLGATGRLGPLINFGAGAGSEGLGEVAHEVAPGLEPYARVVGAVLGGSGGAGIPSIVRTGKSAIQPFTQAGRDAIVGQTLNKTASNPQAAVQALDSYEAGRTAYPSAVPGFQLNAGAASRDPGLMVAADTAPKSLIGPTIQANNAIVHGALDRAATGLPEPSTAGSIIQNQLGDTVNGLKAVRDIETKPLYDAARNSPTPVKPFPLLTYTADAIDANKGEPQRVMQQARSLLFTTDKNGRTIPDRSAKGLMATREALNSGDFLGNPNLGGYSRELLGGLKQRIDDAMNAVPQGKAANARYADLSRNLDPFNPDMGNYPRVLSKIVERDPYNKGYVTPDSQVPGMLMRGGIQSGPMVKNVIDASGSNPAVKQALASAYINDFRNAAASKVSEGAAGEPMMTANGASSWMMKHSGGASQVLTPEQMGALRDITSHLRAQAQPVPGSVGSQTFDRLATKNVLGYALTNFPFLKDYAKSLYSGSNRALMDRFYQVLQDPAATATLMKGASAKNIKAAEPILRQLSGSTAYAISRQPSGTESP